MTISSLFQAVQGGLGVSVLPSHFYFPVPNLRSFKRRDWSACRVYPALDFRLNEQLNTLRNELLPFAAEWNFPEAQTDDRHEFHFNNGFFEHVDAEVAYSFARHRKPRRIIEIGCGYSTLAMAEAIRRNQAEGFACDYVGIDPRPAPFLKDGVPGLVELIEAPVQRVPFELFRALGAGDVLFIDSSHVVSMDSDVLFECLRILPELAPGVLVHFHDIFAPLDYPEKFVKTNLCFWGEQYLLEAFLAFNSAFEVVWAGSAMQKFHADALRETFPMWDGSFARMRAALRAFVPTLDGENVWPCSFWIQRS
jgi:predicted O-methyltransferase YrrM